MNNKKIIIVTLFDDNNIGNRLQNYALQQVFLKQGLDVTVLDNGYTTRPKLKETIKYYIKGFCGLFGVGEYKQQFQKYISNKRKRSANLKFDKNNIKKIIKVTNEQAFHKDWSKYDLAVAGSDQIWHRWRDDKFELPFYYLQFLPSEKRVAYAASFGFEQFPLKDRQQHEEGLKGMAYISCREKSGCEIASSIIERKVQQVLDPTLLLSAVEWREIEKQATTYSQIQSNYAFIYFLGEQTDEYASYINKIMKKYNIDNVINFTDIKNRNIGKCGPSGFLSLIDHADYVFTDSFHCTVFSVLFDKRFTVFRRKQHGFEKMFGRIEDLLSSKGKLENIYEGSTRSASNNFNQLYLDSMKYIEKAVVKNNEN